MRRILFTMIFGLYIAVFAGGLGISADVDELLDIIGSPPADFTLNTDYNLNRLIRELELRGKIPITYSIAPYTVRDILDITENYPDALWTNRSLRLISPYIIKNDLFVIWNPGIWLRYRSQNEKLDKFGKMNFGVGGTYGKWSLLGIYRLDSGYYSDPEYYGVRWERIAGKADQVYARYTGKNTYFQIGRDYLKTGLGMALSGIKPYERIQASIDFGEHFNILWFVGQLDEYTEIQDTTKTIYNRYISGHRAQLTWKHFQIAFNELMIYGGVGRQIELYYILPFYAFHGEQLNHRWDDNTLWSLDMKVLIPPFRFQAEGILDDFQIEREVAADREPVEAGFAVQSDVALLSKPILLTQSLRYELVTPWTFNQELPWNRYLYENRPLGASEGNDYYKISANTNFFGKFYGGNLEFHYIRKGVGRIDDQWTAPWIDEPEWTQQFPSGIVERKIGGKISVWCDGLDWNFENFSGQFAIGSSFLFDKISNLNNVEGVNYTQWEAKLDLITRLWYSGF
ncbi:hypothetical protein DRQ33_00120 [bacterium]|nr:MAG: hypothetical protein DRQ33_00120 [bacterium]